jgi:hypothetical protein
MSECAHNNKSNKWLYIGIIFMLVVVIGFLIYFNFEQKKKLEANERRSSPYHPQQVQAKIELVQSIPLPNAYDEAMNKVLHVKNCIENRGIYRRFFDKAGNVIINEQNIQDLYDLSWSNSLFEVDKEINNGFGPVDYKVSSGALNKALIEFKLASNKKLKRNLQNQLRQYEKSNSTNRSICVIVFFTPKEEKKVSRILKELCLNNQEHIVLIDARNDNKPSGSVA